MSFNLVDDAWVPVRYADGREADTSLATLYRDAPAIRELALTFGLEYAATLRLLVAVLQSALDGPSSARQKERWLVEHAERLPAVERYLERWRPRFELFDRQRPFMQRPVGSDVGVATIAALRPDWASGNNATLFDHRFDARPTPLDAGAATRALLTTLLFQPGGGVSRPFNRTDSPGAKALHVFVDGDTLWDTLCLNAATLPADDVARPIWERDEDHSPTRAGTRPDGWLDRATWRSRAVQLLPEADGSVATCRIHQHLKLADGPPFDPYAPVRYAEGDEPTVMRASPAKVVWRDAEPLLRALGRDDEHATVAREAVWIYERRAAERDGRPAVPSLRIIGQVVNQAKVADVRDARLPVSAALLADEARLAIVGALLETADVGAGAVRAAVHAMAVARGAKDGWGLAARRETQYWATTAAPFRAALSEIATSQSVETLVDDVHVPWRAAVCSRARAAFDGCQREATAVPRADLALARGRAALERRLATIKAHKERTT